LNRVTYSVLGTWVKERLELTAPYSLPPLISATMERIYALNALRAKNSNCWMCADERLSNELLAKAFNLLVKNRSRAHADVYRALIDEQLTAENHERDANAQVYSSRVTQTEVSPWLETTRPHHLFSAFSSAEVFFELWAVSLWPVARMSKVGPI
jgi:hypothetical protein